jgi:glycosyltransferase involved in cell wall biosynthesis
MRIGHIISDIRPGTVHLDMSKAIARRGHEVKVYAEDARSSSIVRPTLFTEEGIEIHAINDKRRNPWLLIFDKTFKRLLGRRFFTALYALYRFVRTTQCEVYLVEGDSLAMLVALVSIVQPIKWIACLHDHEHFGVLLGYPGEPRNRIRVRVKRWALDKASGLRANSEVTKNLMVESGIRPERIRVVPLHYVPRMTIAGDLNEYRNKARMFVRARWTVPAECKILISMCRLTPFKGIDLALRGFSVATEMGLDARFMICGGDRIVKGVGSYRNLLERLAKELGIFDRVIFTGSIPFSKVKTYYAAADLHLVPSYIDTFNYSAVEAALTGTLSIVTPLTGSGRWLAEAGAARILMERNETELASTIVQCLNDGSRSDESTHMCTSVMTALSVDRLAGELLAYAAQIAGSARTEN